MKFKNDKLHDKIWHKFIGNRPDFLRRFAGDQNLISDFIKETLDVIHILIRGHNLISGMTEKVIDTLNQI